MPRPRAPSSWRWPGTVDALMKGSLHTDELMAAVVASKLRTSRRMSHCFVMQTPSYPRPFIITDAAINIAPTLQDKARHRAQRGRPRACVRRRAAARRGPRRGRDRQPATCPPRWTRRRCARWPIAARSQGAMRRRAARVRQRGVGRRGAHQGHRLRGRGCGRHPGRARPRERQHARQAARAISAARPAPASCSARGSRSCSRAAPTRASRASHRARWRWSRRAAPRRWGSRAHPSLAAAPGQLAPGAPAASMELQP